MKESGAPETGDLVRAKEDTRRLALYDIEELDCPGIVLECRGTECKVMWSSESTPIGWWPRTQLEVISETR